MGAASSGAGELRRHGRRKTVKSRTEPRGVHERALVNPHVASWSLSP